MCEREKDKGETIFPDDYFFPVAYHGQSSLAEGCS